MRSSFRCRLRRGESMLGTVVTLPEPALGELTASAVDFVWIDCEHGALGAADVQGLAIAARAAGAASLVRLLGPCDPAIGRVLDSGAEGVVVPRVESAAEAARAAERLRYPPDGSRGFAARRGSWYGRDLPSLPPAACMIQLESMGAIEEAEAIAAVDGVDALVVGCADLALALGEHPGTLSETFRAALAHVQRAAEAAGWPLG